MARTTASAVQTILTVGGNYDGTSDLGPFIELATALVTRVKACADASHASLNDMELELIERWLAAHYYMMADRGFSKKETLSAKATFDGRTGMNLEATMYGQTALSFDTSGCLRKLTMAKTASMQWLGKTESEQLDYEDRN